MVKEKDKTVFKLIVNLERDGLCQAMTARDLHELNPKIKIGYGTS